MTAVRSSSIVSSPRWFKLVAMANRQIPIEPVNARLLRPIS